MKVAAPGKLLLFGAYAVLDGAPAIVIAVDRHAVADDSGVASPASREVRAAFGDAPAPLASASALYEGDAKLGLGSSAAVLVASLGIRAARRGDDLTRPEVRRAIFREAREAHAVAQGGGSGVDVAASTFGGALSYRLLPEPEAKAIPLPSGLSFVAFWSGTSARTSELVSRVTAFRARDPQAYASSVGAIAAASQAAHEALASDDTLASGASRLAQFLAAARSTAHSLSALGHAADAPIVPPQFAELAILAEREGGAFFPSGAGGGDVGVWLGAARPSEAFVARARSVAMHPIDLGLDYDGVKKRED